MCDKWIWTKPSRSEKQPGEYAGVRYLKMLNADAVNTFHSIEYEKQVYFLL